MRESSFQLEKRLFRAGYDLIIGIDEAGRGPLAGPVVAAATTIKDARLIFDNTQISSLSSDVSWKDPEVLAGDLPATIWNLIRDSKTLSPKQREKVFDFVQKHFFVGIGICQERTIDRLNILQAAHLAMKKALSDLFFKMRQEFLAEKGGNFLSQAKPVILLDGVQTLANFSYKQIAIARGDQLVKTISAASIAAKVTRDRLMFELHKKYPQYNFCQHKGYGTKEHLEVLSRLGPCRAHRFSFKPVKKFAKKK